MEFGGEEWIEKLKENYKFPCKIAFILNKDTDGSVRIFSTLIKSSSKIENVKYSKISRLTWTTEGSAVLSVKEMMNAEDYLQETKKLRDIWGFALREADNL